MYLCWNFRGVKRDFSGFPSLWPLLDVWIVLVESLFRTEDSRTNRTLHPEAVCRVLVGILLVDLGRGISSHQPVLMIILALFSLMGGTYTYSHVSVLLGGGHKWRCNSSLATVTSVDSTFFWTCYLLLQAFRNWIVISTTYLGEVFRYPKLIHPSTNWNNYQYERPKRIRPSAGSSAFAAPPTRVANNEVKSMKWRKPIWIGRYFTNLQILLQFQVHFVV